MTIQQVGVKYMKPKIYLACYKGKTKKHLHRLCDKITKFFTRGQYSHCEIVVFERNQCYCYSSSIRDGGVRIKKMDLNPEHWDFFALPYLEYHQLYNYFNATVGSGYDLWGALGCVAGLRQHKSKYFCSEWCFNAIFQSEQGWRFSPSQLADIVKSLNTIQSG